MVMEYVPVEACEMLLERLPPPQAASASSMRRATSAATIRRRRLNPTNTAPTSPKPGNVKANTPRWRFHEAVLTSPTEIVSVEDAGELVAFTEAGLKEQLTPG